VQEGGLNFERVFFLFLLFLLLFYFQPFVGGTERAPECEEYAAAEAQENIEYN
jgi:hypothetical protein